MCQRKYIERGEFVRKITAEMARCLRKAKSQITQKPIKILRRRTKAQEVARGIETKI